MASSSFQTATQKNEVSESEVLLCSLKMKWRHAVL